MAWVIVVVAAFTLAIRLEPDARGYGTHQKLGLPPCTFRYLWQIPCPSCGGTTAFSLFIRGDWPSAAAANVGGLFLAVVFALSIPWSVVSAWKGHAWRLRDPFWTALLLMLAFVSLTVVHWMLKLFVLRLS